MRKPLFANVGGGQTAGEKVEVKRGWKELERGGKGEMVEVSMESLSSPNEELMCRRWWRWVQRDS